MSDISSKGVKSTLGNYVILDQIGSGGFSQVYRAMHIPTHLPVAIKIIDKEGFPLEKFQRELDVLKTLYHPFCVSFYESIEDEKYYYLIMEYIQGQTLLDFLNQTQTLPDFAIRHFFCQLISALDYIHNVVHFIHRDLKVENIMIDRFNNIRLIDFGLGNSVKTEGQLLSTACGSAAYAAPELLRGEAYSYKADLWSAGVILYAMSTGELPFEDPNIQRLVSKIVITQPVYPEGIDRDLLDLLKHILQKDPTRRYNIEEIMEHPWFQRYHFASSMNKNLGIEECFRTEDNRLSIDPETVTKMKNSGLNANEAIQEIEQNIFGSSSAAYRIYRKDAVSLSLACLFSRSRLSNHTHPAQASLPSLISRYNNSFNNNSAASAHCPTNNLSNTMRNVCANSNGNETVYTPIAVRKYRRLSNNPNADNEPSKLAEGKESTACQSMDPKQNTTFATRHRTISPIMMPCVRKRGLSFCVQSPIAYSDGT